MELSTGQLCFCSRNFQVGSREAAWHSGREAGTKDSSKVCTVVTRHVGREGDGQKWRNEAWLKPEAAEWQWWDKKAQEGAEEKEFGALWAHINFPFSSCSHKLSPSLLVQVLAEES